MEKSFLWGKLRNLAQEAQIQEALECVPLNYKIGEAYKGKKPPQNYVSCLWRIIIEFGKK